MRASIVIVSFNSSEALKASLPPLLSQLQDGDEVIVVDNASTDGSAALVRERWPECTLVETGANLGFAAGCNRGAAVASGDVLLFLNPDAVAGEGFLDALRGTDRWDAWMGLVTMGGGRRVNTSGGVAHFTGVAWAGQAGQAVAAAGADARDVGFVSGACFAIKRAAWQRAGGFSEPFFMYHEDVDLSFRLRLAGAAIGIEPAAHVDHDYEFHKRPAKWRLLERNRAATVIRTFPPRLLLLLAPGLIATELALVVVSVAGGWGQQKLLAAWDTLRALPRLLRERRQVQATRVVSEYEFARHLTHELSSAYLGRVADLRPLTAVLAAYWRFVLKRLPR